VVAVAGIATIMLGVALGIVAGVGASPADPLLGSVALGAVVAAPGLLALLGLRHRAVLWLPAAMAALPLSFLSFAGLTLPLLVLAVILVVAWIRHPGSYAGFLVHPVVVTSLVVVLLIAAALALFVHEDPASWTTETDGFVTTGETSDIVTNREALLSLGCTGLALAVGWTLTQRRHRDRHPIDHG
jgi:hypothetical protein